jgi:hypothetical protein
LHIGVGTPNRILKIWDTDPSAIPLDQLEYIVIDGWLNKARLSICDLDDTRKDLILIRNHIADSQIKVVEFDDN